MNELQIHTLLEQAGRYFENDKTLHAIQLLKQVIAASPSCERAYVMLSQVYSESHRPDLAEKTLLQGLERNKGNTEYYFLLGNLELSQLHFEKALGYFEKIGDLGLPNVHLSLGLIYMGLGRLAESEIQFKQASDLDPQLPKLHELWGELLLGQERTDEAVEILKEAVRIDEYSGTARRLLGEAFARRAQWQMAYDNLVMAVDMDPDDAEAWGLCGEVLLHMNSVAEAKNYLQRSLQLKPDYPEAQANYGKACDMLGDSDSLR